MQNTCWKVKWQQDGSAAQKNGSGACVWAGLCAFLSLHQEQMTLKCSKDNSVPGSLVCSLRVSLHLWGIGPTNGTCPVGLRREKKKSPGRLTDTVHQDKAGFHRPSYKVYLRCGYLPSTTCPHTSHGTHGCRAGLAGADGTQNHSYIPRTCSQTNISISKVRRCEPI